MNEGCFTASKLFLRKNHVITYLEGVPRPQKLIDHIAGADLSSSPGVGFFTTTPRYLDVRREQRISNLFFHHILYPAGGARAPYQPVVVRGIRGVRRQVYPIEGSLASTATDPLRAPPLGCLQDVPESIWARSEPAQAPFFYTSRSEAANSGGPSVQHSLPRWKAYTAEKHRRSMLTGFPNAACASPKLSAPLLHRKDSAFELLAGGLNAYFNSSQEGMLQRLEPLLANKDAGFVYLLKDKKEKTGSSATGFTSSAEVFTDVRRLWSRGVSSVFTEGSRAGYVALRLPESAVVRALLPGSVNGKPREVCRLSGGNEPCVPFAVGSVLKPGVRSEDSSSVALSQTLFGHINILARVSMPSLGVDREIKKDASHGTRTIVSTKSLSSEIVGIGLDSKVPHCYRMRVEPSAPLMNRELACDDVPSGFEAPLQLCVGRQDAEMYLLPHRELLLTLFVPSSAEQMCAEQNRQRAEKQLRLSNVGAMTSPQMLASNGRLTSSTTTLMQYQTIATGNECGQRTRTGHLSYRIRALPGDVVYVPRGWCFNTRRVLGGTIRGGDGARDTRVSDNVERSEKLQSDETKNETNGDNTSISRVEVDGFLVLYRPYPVLTQDQANAYVSANYVHRGVSEFYANGGNDVYHQYE